MSDEHKTRKTTSGETLLEALVVRGVHPRLLDFLGAEDIRELTLKATYADNSTAVVQYDMTPIDH